ncbi:MAG: hypothetical protein ABSG53_27815 [Thermoguttaceae bacterium]
MVKENGVENVEIAVATSGRHHRHTAAFDARNLPPPLMESTGM